MKVRDGQVANRPFYIAIGVDLAGHKDVLGLWAGAGVGSRRSSGYRSSPSSADLDAMSVAAHQWNMARVARALSAAHLVEHLVVLLQGRAAELRC